MVRGGPGLFDVVVVDHRDVYPPAGPQQLPAGREIEVAHMLYLAIMQGNMPLTLGILHSHPGVMLVQLEPYNQNQFPDLSRNTQTLAQRAYFPDDRQSLGTLCTHFPYLREVIDRINNGRPPNPHRMGREPVLRAR